MEILLNSNVLPILSVGMYESHLDARYVFDDARMNEEFENGESPYNSEQFWDNFDNDAYVAHVQKRAKRFYDDEYTHEGISVTLECGEIYSPREYNFATDQIELTVTFDKNKIKKFAKDNKDAFSDFLKENYSSYDGFCSFTANRFDEWLVAYCANEAQEIGAALTFWFKVADQTEQWDQLKELAFVYDLHENTYEWEFYKEPANA